MAIHNKMNKHNNINTMNVFILTMQSKMAMMQKQVSELSSTIAILQTNINELTEELSKVKSQDRTIVIPRVFEDYTPDDKKNIVDPLEPITVESYVRDLDSQFIIVSDVESETDSDSEYDLNA